MTNPAPSFLAPPLERWLDKPKGCSMTAIEIYEAAWNVARTLDVGRVTIVGGPEDGFPPLLTFERHGNTGRPGGWNGQYGEVEVPTLLLPFYQRLRRAKP